MGEQVDRYAVVGNPIAHSKSPQIHTRFAAQCAQALRYDPVLVEQEGFSTAVETFRSEGMKGINVTVPFKQDAWRVVDTRDGSAERAGAVNTIDFRSDGTLAGYNTDGVGLLRDLTANHGVELEGRQVLVLGAGGAVRGVLEPLLNANPAQVLIANRTESRARQLVDVFTALGPVEACGYAGLGGRFDLIVNGTAAGLAGELPPLPDDILKEGGCCYDMIYGDHAEPFAEWARAHGAGLILDGLGMLVEQAAEAFLIWRGVRPDTGAVITEMRGSG